jgi:site-specific recombinase XerC
VRDLNYQLKRLCYDNRQGSEATQAARRYILNQIADQLCEMGYRGMSSRSLKPKHVEALVKRWTQQGLSTGTIKNRMNALRPVWIAVTWSHAPTITTGFPIEAS